MNGDSSPAIAALVLNYNQRDRTIRFVRDLVQAEPDLLELVIVENSDPPVLRKEDLPAGRVPVRLVAPGRNLGVAGGRNLGISAALESSGWNYLAMLDNDLIVPEGSLRALAAALNSIPASGVAGPCVVDAAEPSRVVAVGGNILPLFYPKYFGHGSDVGSLEPGPARVTSFVQGGATLYRRAVLEMGVRFDERFNPYGPEDIDFCLASAAAGFSVVVAPGVRIGHEGHATYKTTLRHQKHLAAGDTLLRLKWAKHPYLAIAAYLGWKVARALVRAPWSEKSKAGAGAITGVAGAIRKWGGRHAE